MLSLPDSYKGYITADIIYSAGINEQEIIIDMGFTIETGISAITVFVQGLLSFFSPCVLPLVPLYLGYLSGGLNSGLNGTEKEEAGASASAAKIKLFVRVLFFALGISGAFFVLGLGASAAGSFSANTGCSLQGSAVC